MQITQKTNFKAFEKALSMNPRALISLVKKAGLRGRGGACFLTGLKWELTRKAKNPNKVLICNADEGEPGVFKDRFIIMNNPELLIEGIAIACYAVGAKRAYIYLRAEYESLKTKLDNAIKRHSKKLKRVGLKLDVFVGAGAYICGDETAIMNSIEGIRPEPRPKPPYPSEQGLYGLPTCINNVETLVNVPLIIKGGWKDIYLFSLSGNLSKPGIYEFSMGIEAKELISAGAPLRKIKALFFGCAGGCVPYKPSIRIDASTITDLGAMLGSCAVIAVDVKQSIPCLCENIARFFVHESCGHCTPCREGNFRVLELLEKINKGAATKTDLKTLEEIACLMKETSFCGLGQSSANHLLTALKYFRKEFEEKCS